MRGKAEGRRTTRDAHTPPPHHPHRDLLTSCSHGTHARGQHGCCLFLVVARTSPVSMWICLPCYRQQVGLPHPPRPVTPPCTYARYTAHLPPPPGTPPLPGHTRPRRTQSRNPATPSAAPHRTRYIRTSFCQHLVRLTLLPLAGGPPSSGLTPFAQAMDIGHGTHYRRAPFAPDGTAAGHSCVGLTDINLVAGQHWADSWHSALTPASRLPRRHAPCTHVLPHCLLFMVTFHSSSLDYHSIPLAHLPAL